MKLDDSAKFWHRLWSVRFAILAALVSAAGELLPLWQPMLAPIPYATLSTVFAILSAVSRVVHQGGVQTDLDSYRSGQ
ncbi:MULTISPECIES: hypothetical protein [Pseudomonadota]|jgi:hypothetical protein|uniref:DUF7940 domain-containing protein n=1 Tax=Pseudomonadota TaxID=1224 RepID=UPI0006D3CF2A|nr:MULTISPECIES: hypothetical protein [Gammaproteobacteria]MBG7114710.1 hypothetical protein [Pseudomonas aeruginosa]HDT5887838.1 hypothetical protein [Aeromonas dhakensis]HEB4980710.1 hypothetical protein [Aeromonas dhakensis]